MLARGSHVFADTNVIIEAHRASCWGALTGAFRMDTVSRCIEELNTGRRRPVQVDTQALAASVQPKVVTPAQVAKLAFLYPESSDLDPGEQELLAFVMDLPADTFFVCSPDKAAIRAAHVLKIIERYVALEDLTDAAGIRADLREQYTKRFMAQQRSRLLLEDLG